jgi:hypothetical protein
MVRLLILNYLITKMGNPRDSLSLSSRPTRKLKKLLIINKSLMVELLDLTFPVVPLVVVIVPKSLEEIEVVALEAVKHLGKLPQFLWATLDSTPLLSH